MDHSTTMQKSQTENMLRLVYMKVTNAALKVDSEQENEPDFGILLPHKNDVTDTSFFLISLLFRQLKKNMILS